MEFEDEVAFNKNSQIFALSWVKRKAAKSVPQQMKLTQDDLKVLMDRQGELEDLESVSTISSKTDDNEKSSQKSFNEDKSSNDENEDDDLKEFDFDNYDNEDDNPIVNGVPNLLVYASNDDDPYMRKDKENIQEESDNESDDLNLIETDNLLVCAHCETNYAQLNIYVYNDVTNDFYIHHDIPLPSAPLCLHWMNYAPVLSPTADSSNNQGNFVAVGNFDSQIAIWDLDVVNTFEPSFTLGAPKKKHKNLILQGKEDFGHKDAVLDLSWTLLLRNQLASASADRLVALWDLEKLKISNKLKQHNAKVQTISWQPTSSNCLLSGTFNGRVYALDTRAPSGGNTKWSLENEIERVAWNNSNTEYFAVSNNVGTIYYCDVRNPGKTLFSFKAHDDAIPALSVTSSSLCSGSSDGFVKLWNLSDDSAELKQSKSMNMGSVHCFQFNPDVSNLLAVGGQKNGIKLWNLESDKQKIPNEVKDDDEMLAGASDARNIEKTFKKQKTTNQYENSRQKKKKLKTGVKKSTKMHKNKRNTKNNSDTGNKNK